MAPDSWAGAHEPLEMLELLREPLWHYSARQRRRHPELLNSYTLRCLTGIGADSEAALFDRCASGGSEFADEAGVQALEARAARRGGGGYTAGHRPRHLSADAQRARAALSAIRSLGGYDGSPWWAAVAATRETQHLLQREQCAWLRCLFPTPFATAPIGTDWLTSTVIELARGIVAENAFDRLPILADALQDAACGCESLLHHCRHDTDHGPRCWAVAAILEAHERR